MLLEQIAVLFEFLSNWLNLNEFERISIHNVSSNILFKQFDDFQGLLVMFDGFDKQLVWEALIVLECFDFGSNGVSSCFIPCQIVFGLLEDVLIFPSVDDGLIEEFLIQCLDLWELFNCLSTNPLICFVLLVSSKLSIDVGLLQIIQQPKHCVYGITCLCSCLQKS